MTTKTSIPKRNAPRQSVADDMGDDDQIAGFGGGDLNAFKSVAPFVPIVKAEERQQSIQAKLEQAISEAAKFASENSSLQEELSQRQAVIEKLQRDVENARKEGDPSECYYLDPELISDPFPQDRFDSAYSEESLRALAQDISSRGQDFPILVRPKPDVPDGTLFEIAAGKRRLAACKLVGRQVFARVRAMSNEAMLRARFGENYHRQDLSALERARYYKHSMEMMGLSMKDLAALYEVDLSLISHVLRLNRIPPSIVGAFREPYAISLRACIELVSALEKHRTPHAETRALQALSDFHSRKDAGEDFGTLDEVRVALAAIRDNKPVMKPMGRRAALPVFHGKRQIAGALQRDGRWVISFDKTIDEEFIGALLDRLPDVFASMELKTDED
ncbi:ParB/RepB/Spo0J family partition protein [Sabulicella glaciei]|uniref:ParB/RepB/Spo0J family partition protein n=1 Tax=Sabulicella glaciei TaxID=2984948 RepID=A0ABT3P1M6_9PROT|nr:ParB/RepB/Spo0J family partition protein [Roseococcus sp. MDT2-1-1]MCW8088291.1 ParB/RepB/Spo0J family partition protein [Roseococcus sp. MDT2-1-1]